MPSFLNSLGQDRETLQDVVLFLDSLVLPRAKGRLNLRSRGDEWVGVACTACHDEHGLASGAFRHRCGYLKERADTLNCQRCHGSDRQAIVNPSAPCPVVEAHRGACAVCHDPVEGR